MNFRKFLGNAAAIVMVGAFGIFVAPVYALHDANGCTVTPETVAQLKAARQATGRYHSLAVASANDYVDINLPIANMGEHFLNFNLLMDGQFDAAAPEALVYADLGNGKRTLVALEYIVPIALSPNGPPEGFAGDCDVWGTFNNELWTLHAWVWHPNLSGLFAPYNPLVP
jgi:hypothetical protein